MADEQCFLLPEINHRVINLTIFSDARSSDMVSKRDNFWIALLLIRISGHTEKPEIHYKSLGIQIP